MSEFANYRFKINDITDKWTIRRSFFIEFEGLDEIEAKKMVGVVADKMDHFVNWKNELIGAHGEIERLNERGAVVETARQVRGGWRWYHPDLPNDTVLLDTPSRAYRT